uniref:CIP29 n=1 Tax=Schmidtea mediterranea TaxID=79327 RepID=H9CXU0_SCHMD|nr:CIP29 [Schmidtea mediterranea]
MEDLTKLKVNDLRKKCKDLGLSITGNKSELISRIQDRKNEGGDESVLNEAELLGELDGSDSQVVSNVDEDLLLGDSTSESKEEKNENNLSSILQIDEPLSEPPVITDVEEPSAKIPKLDMQPIKETDKVLTIDNSEEKKKQDRAARFGIITNDTEENKKLARAQRFGLDVSKSNGDVTVDIEKLKKREERFGVSVSDKLSKAADEEKKLKRAERFGVQTSIQVESVGGVNLNDDKKAVRAARFGLNTDEEKKKARAARFGN